MARNQTTWPKGQKPPVKKPKGRKNNKTLLKEKIGLTGWQEFEKFVEDQGAKKLIKEIKTLKGKNYTTALAQFTEFVKPKLARTDIDFKGDLTTTIVEVGGKKAPDE